MLAANKSLVFISHLPLDSSGLTKGQDMSQSRHVSNPSALGVRAIRQLRRITGMTNRGEASVKKGTGKEAGQRGACNLACAAGIATMLSRRLLRCGT